MGEVEISGAKNAALAILAATILTDETVTIENVPNVTDTNVMLQALVDIGATVKHVDEHTVRINTSTVHSMKLEEEQVIFTKVHLDRDDGRLIYEIEFIFEKVEYEFDVDARTDRIIESDRDYQDFDRDYDFDYDDWFDFD